MPSGAEAGPEGVGRCRHGRHSAAKLAAGTGCHYQIHEGGHDWYRIGGFDTTGAVWGFVAPWLGSGSPARRPWATPAGQPTAPHMDASGSGQTGRRGRDR